MKQILTLSLNTFLFFLFPFVTNAQYTQIPDVNFERALIADGIDTERILDGQILTADAQVVDVLELSNLDITDLTGISAFTNLTFLDCTQNQITALDVSANSSLTTLYCFFNQIASINLPTSNNLTLLHCSTNQLSSIDVSANTNLNVLNLGSNNLSSIDVSTNTNLVDFSIGYNQLTSIDISSNTNLLEFGCPGNMLTSLDVSANVNLEVLVTSFNQIPFIDLSLNTNLITFISYFTELTSLDVSANINLVNLFFSYNLITTLDISTNTNLERLYCDNNLLNSLNISLNSNMLSLFCDNNQLGNLDLRNGNNTMLNLTALNNPLLDCIDVDDVSYAYNNFTEVDPGTIFSLDCAAPLPVELTEFSGFVFKDKRINLIWKTTSESNFYGFEIQKSRQGANWERVGFVQGNGSTRGINKYTFFDLMPYNGENYYRLKQIDLDGAIKYSKVIIVDFDTKEDYFLIYPNPSKGDFVFQINNPLKENVEVIVSNEIGEKVLENNLLDREVVLKGQLNIQEGGLYFVSIKIGNKVYHKKIIVIN